MIALSELSEAEVLRYMGVKGDPDPNVLALVRKYEPEVRKKLRPAYVYRESAVEVRENGVFLTDIGLLLTGEDVKKHLAGCERAVLLAATVSAEADKLIRQAGIAGMADALAVDCLCTAAIEQVCDSAENEIFAENRTSYRTWRFSPGYGDLPISLQKDVVSVLNANRRIGLTVTGSFMLVPSKSVTAVIGISERPPEHKSGRCCVNCNMYGRCSFSKTTPCGGQNVDL